MTSIRTYPLALAMLGLTLACGEDSLTEPSSSPLSTQPELMAAAAGRWVTRADMVSTTRSGVATAPFTNSAGQTILYAMGGRTESGGSLSRVLAYNVETNTWSWKAPMPFPLFRSNGAGVIGGKVYISGGFTTEWEYNLGFFMYDPATNRWTQKKAPPGPSYDGVTGVLNNKLYVVTNCDDPDCEPSGNLLYRYDPATDQWSMLAPPPTGFGIRVGGIIAGKFYVTGDGRALGVYDPATNQWTVRTTGSNLGTPQTGVKSNGKLYWFGRPQQAPDGSTKPGTTHVYDPRTNVWTQLASMPSVRGGMTAGRVVLNGQMRIHLVGGPRPGNNLAFIP